MRQACDAARKRALLNVPVRRRNSAPRSARIVEVEEAHVPTGWEGGHERSAVR